MKPLTFPSGLVGAWLVLEALLYWLFVPEPLAVVNFLWISGVLLLLVVVSLARWQRSGADDSIANVLYDAEHPTVERKR
jgi:hypothetical protein